MSAAPDSPPPHRLLVADRYGQLARALPPCFAAAGWTVRALGRADGLDLAGPAAAIEGMARAGFAPLAPDLVVNAAAYTAVDRAEAEPEAAQAVNRDGAQALARAAAALGAPLAARVHRLRVRRRHRPASPRG